METMKVDLYTTIQEAQDFLNNFKYRGAICPCCNSKQKIWRKPLIGTAIVELIKLCYLFKIKKEEIHISMFSAQRSNFYTLKYWGLIEGSEKAEGKRTAGMWKPTEKGVDFIFNRIKIPSHAETKNNELLNLSGDPIDVITALGKKFNYDELMKKY